MTGTRPQDWYGFQTAHDQGLPGNGQGEVQVSSWTQLRILRGNERARETEARPQDWHGLQPAHDQGLPVLYFAMAVPCLDKTVCTGISNALVPYRAP